MSNQIFNRNLEYIRSQCAIQDSKYWNISLQEDEFTVDTDSDSHLCIETTDGYGITMKPHFIRGYQGCINGYVQIPRHVSFLEEPGRANVTYDFINDFFDMPVEMTYYDNDTCGWDHMHCYDADLLRPEFEQLDHKRVYGPVQVLEEARQVIAEFRAKDDDIKMSMKHAQINIIQEELMMKTCHPHRIATWASQGFDPFL